MSGLLVLLAFATFSLELLINEEVLVTVFVVHVALDNELAFTKAHHVVGVGTLSFCLLLDPMDLKVLRLLPYFFKVVPRVLAFHLHLFVLRAAEVISL